ncbi:MAG: mechanosensitive ion channel [Bacteroidia bacterium]|nr:mechanosensitive ion channel [Bacteroidia bacterium]
MTIMVYIWITAVALFLFFFLRFTSKWLPGLPAGKRTKRTILRAFPVIEFGIWVVFAVKSIGLAFGDTPFYQIMINAMVLVVALICAWYFLRDFVAGIVLKSENGFEPGMEIDTPFARGTVRKAGYRSLELTDANGHYVRIPYSRISGEVISKPSNNKKRVEHELELGFGSNQEISAIKQQIRKRALELPWIVKEESLKVEINSLSPEKYMAKIKFYSVTPETAVKTEESIRKFIAENYFPI